MAQTKKIYIPIYKDLAPLIVNTESLFKLIQYSPVTGTSSIKTITPKLTFDSSTSKISVTYSGTTTAVTAYNVTIAIGPFTFRPWIACGATKIGVIYAQAGAPNINKSTFMLSTTTNYSGSAVYTKAVNQTSSAPITVSDTIDISSLTDDYYFVITNSSSTYSMGSSGYGAVTNPSVTISSVA